MLIASFAAGCAYEGTIVRKDYRPLPFSYSLGLDALYHFELRGSDGRVHSQLVTAAAFATYQVGDYFNDLSPAPRAVGSLPAQDFPPAPGPLENFGSRYPRVPPFEPAPHAPPSPRG